MALLDLGLPDELEAADSAAAEVVTFQPLPADSAAGADSALREHAAHRLPEDSAAVGDSLEVLLPSLSPRPADTAEVGDAAEALLFVTPVVISSYTPRGRVADSVEILGTGFSASSNAVHFGGIAATVTVHSTTRVVATVPALLAVILPNAGQFVTLQVLNNGTGRLTQVPWWYTRALADLLDDALPQALPGPLEVLDQEDPERAQSKDYERLATLAELLTRDLLTAEGDMFARDAAGLQRLPAAASKGQVAVADSSQATGVRWGWAQDLTLAYGGQIASGTTTEQKLNPNGRKIDGVSTSEAGVPLAGLLDLITVYQHSTAATTDRLDRVRVLKNGAQVYDSGTGVNKTHRELFQARVALSVAAGDRLELACTKTGTASAASLAGHLRVAAT